MTLISEYNNIQEKCNYIYSSNNQLKNRWTMLQNFAYLCNNYVIIFLIQFIQFYYWMDTNIIKKLILIYKVIISIV